MVRPQRQSDYYQRFAATVNRSFITMITARKPPLGQNRQLRKFCGVSERQQKASLLRKFLRPLASCAPPSS